MQKIVYGVVALAVCCTASPQAHGDSTAGTGWPRHTIDDSSRGADGVRPQDVNGDRWPDLVTGWEEGGRIRACLHPGSALVRERWPAVTVGQVGSPEDAVFADLDGDGQTDVVSSCEGKTRAVYVHWAPRSADRFLVPEAWRTEPFPALSGRAMWMFCLPMQVDGRHGVDLVLGGKGTGAEIGWLAAPADAQSLAEWQWRPLRPAGWVMSLVAVDMDGDGDQDLLFTDRKGKTRGCRWLEHPGRDAAATEETWREHVIGGANAETMFAVPADLDGDGLLDVAAATSDGGLLLFRRSDPSGQDWQATSLPMPAGTGTGKGINVGDLDLDGANELVVTCENAQGRHGVFLLDRDGADGDWKFAPISGDAPGTGVKFDLIQLLDLDGDGDLDLVTCEERDNLGVVWYENPAR